MNFKRFHESKNLFDKYAEYTAGQTAYQYTISGLTPNQKYTCSTNFVAETDKEAAIYFNGGSTVTNGVDYRRPRTFTCGSSGTMTVFVRFRSTPESNPAIYDDLMNGTIWIMVNEGSTPQPYEPYSSEVWHDTSHYIHNTSTDTITTLPAVLYPNAVTATVGLKGQMEQSGTPTSQNPIQPQETGERTGNVMPAGELKTVESNGVTFSSDGKGKYSISGTATAYASARFNLLSPFTTPISVSNGGQGTLSFFNTQANNNVTFIFYNGATKVDEWKQTPSNRVSTTYIAVGNKYVDNIVITVVSGATVDITITPEFTNDGVIPESFEKYGIKIPISSANTTTPVYLGEVETTRKIKKLVLTGAEENWIGHGSIQSWYQLTINDVIIDNLELCTHYKPSTHSAGDIENGEIIAIKQSVSNSGRIIIKDTNCATKADFLAYLAQQYAAGTPVCVWYVLANPTTGIVNEPLRKIGDYADTVSGITIPTITGANTLSVDTTLQPSEITVGYKGWHPVTDVHERDNGAWT